MNKTLNDFLTTGQHPQSQRESAALLDAARSALLSPKTKMQTNKIFNMSDQKVIEIFDAHQRSGKGTLLDKLATEHLRAENTRPSTVRPSTRPAPSRPAAARPAPAPPRPAAISNADAARWKQIPDSMVIQGAYHRHSPPAEKAECLAELARRGYVCGPRCIIKPATA